MKGKLFSSSSKFIWSDFSTQLGTSRVGGERCSATPSVELYNCVHFLYAVCGMCTMNTLRMISLTVVYEYIPLCTVHVYASPPMFSISTWVKPSTAATTTTTGAVCQFLLSTNKASSPKLSKPFCLRLTVAVPIKEPADASFNCSM